MALLFAVNNVLAQNNFNLEVEIADTYKTLSPGENIWFTTKIMNLANKERMDITLEYKIMNSNSTAIATKSETFAVETQASFVGSIKIPSDASKGEYALETVLFVNNAKEAESKDTFNIIKSNKAGSAKTIIILVFFLIVVLIIFLALKSRKIIEKIKIKAKIHKIVIKKQKELTG